jgi:AcrR family transcriptional regulator
MARPKSITDEEILEAARETFLERGAQATTAEIAEHAGISEGTIYSRFDTKGALFRQAMDIPYPSDWMDLVEDLPERVERKLNETDRGLTDILQEDLQELGLAMTDFFVDIAPKMHTVMEVPFDIDDLPMTIGRGDVSVPPPVHGLKVTTQMFHRMRQRGYIRQCDPEILARNFVGVVYHFAFSEMTGINDYLPMPRETYIRGFVHQIIHGVAGTSDS